MRYSRFRAGMLGLEPQKRKRANTDKVSKTKLKKGGKGGVFSKDDSIGVASENASSDIAEMKHRIQEECQRSASPSALETLHKQQKNSHTLSLSELAASSIHLSPADTLSLADTQFIRLLTPCSDSDFKTHQSPYATSPTSEMLPQPFIHSINNNSVGTTHDQEGSAWTTDIGSLPPYPAYDLGSLPLDLYGNETAHQSQGLTQSFEYSLGHDHGYEHSFQQDQLCPQPTTSMQSQTSGDDLAAILKHEDWDAQLLD